MKFEGVKIPGIEVLRRVDHTINGVELSGEYSEDSQHNGYFEGIIEGVGVGIVRLSLVAPLEKANECEISTESLLANKVAKIIETAYDIKYTTHAWDFDCLDENYSFRQFEEKPA